MSRDFDLQQECPHRVVREWLALDDDRRTVDPVDNPVGSEVELYINDQEVPEQGYYSNIEVTSSISGPFDISSDQRDIVLSVHQGPDQTITLPAGSSLPARRIASIIHDSVDPLQVESDNQGYLHLRTTTQVQRTKQALFLKDGSAHDAIGLPDRKFYQNRQIYPSWAIVKDEGPFGSINKKIVFEHPLDDPDATIEMSYTTTQENCRRCRGTGTEHDIRYNQSGDPIFTRHENLLLQEVEKIITTQKGSNLFYPWYGSDLVNRIGDKITQNTDMIESELTREISQTLDDYKQIKVEQSDIQPVSDREFLLRVDHIRVERDEFDPTMFHINIRLVNRNQVRREISKTIALNQS